MPRVAASVSKPGSAHSRGIAGASRGMPLGDWRTWSGDAESVVPQPKRGLDLGRRPPRLGGLSGASFGGAIGIEVALSCYESSGFSSSRTKELNGVLNSQRRTSTRSDTSGRRRGRARIPRVRDQTPLAAPSPDSDASHIRGEDANEPQPAPRPGASHPGRQPPGRRGSGRRLPFGGLQSARQRSLTGAGGPRHRGPRGKRSRAGKRDPRGLQRPASPRNLIARGGGPVTLVMLQELDQFRQRPGVRAAALERAQ